MHIAIGSAIGRCTDVSRPRFMPPGRSSAYFAPAALSMVLNSPDLYISIVVSQPPMNSPFTNTCDDVSTVRIPASACDQAAAPIRGMHAPAGWSASW